MRAFLRGLLVSLAGLLVLLFAGLWFAEESGLTLRLLREALTRRLGPLAERVEIGALDLEWFRPGVVLREVTLRPLEDGQPALRLDELRLTLDARLERLRRVELHGGRLRLGEGLFADWDRFRTASAGSGPSAPASPAEVRLQGLELELELFDGSSLELGTLALAGRPREAGYDLAGELAPNLGGALTSTEPIRVHGRVTAESVQARARAHDLLVRSRAHPTLAGLLPVAVRECSARLTLEAEVSLAFAEAARPQGKLRANLAEGTLALHAGLPAVHDLELALEASLAPPPGQGPWTRAAWDARARLAAELAGSPLALDLELGRDVRDGGWLEAYGHVREVALAPENLVALGLERPFGFVRQMLAPRGTVTLAFDALARGTPGTTPEGEAIVLVRGGKELHLSYLGFPGDPDSGLPLEVLSTGGELLVALRAPAPRPWRLFAHELSGDHGKGTVTGWTQVEGAAGQVPGAARLQPDFDLVLASPAVPLDERLRAALGANRHLGWLVTSFAPTAGTLSGQWRMHGAAGGDGLAAQGDFRLDSATLSWADVPVPLEKIQGDIAVRFGARAGHSTGTPSYARRPFGVRYTLDNRREPRTGTQARVAGWVREEEVPPTFAPNQAFPILQELSIDLDELGLRGQAFELLARRFPALRREVESYGAVGRLHVAYHGAQAAVGGPFVSSIEAIPIEVQVKPQVFQRQTRELAGRILVRTESGPRGELSAAQMVLTGQWPGGVELFARGEVPSHGLAHVAVLGAGIDPTNTSFKGALSTSLNAASPTAGIDLSAWTLAGRVDFALEASFDPASAAPAENRYTIQLRDNDLVARDLVLRDLNGTFRQEGAVLSSPRVTASLGGHPLELTQVETFALADVARFEGADPWLTREGFWSDPSGRALQADVTTLGLPLDAAHLAGLISPEALAVLASNESWRGTIDVLGARLVVTSEFENDGKVAVRGPMRLRDLALRLGIPLGVERATVDLKELVQESERLRGWAEITAIEATLAERELGDGRLIASYVDGRLTIDNLSGDFEGGRLEALGGSASKALGIDLSEPYRFDVGLALSDVDVGGLLRGVFQSSIADEGVLDATLQLSGTPDDVLGLTGRGSLSLDEGALWSIPVVRELFGQLGFDRAGLFDRLRARFELRDGRIQISRLELQSNLLDLVGAGWQDLDGELSYDFEVRYGLLDRLGFVGRALYWFNNNLMRVAVRGDFDRPLVSIRNSVLELLRRFDERPDRGLPMPPFSALGERF